MGQLFDTEKKKMTEADRLRVGAEHARLALTLDALREEKRDALRTFRVKIRELEEKTLTLAGQLDEGATEIRFEVEERPDDARLMVEIYRKDTGQRLSVRPMTEVEKLAAAKRKQGDLFDGPDPEENPIHEGEGDTEPPPGNVRQLPRGKGKRPRR